MKQQNPKPPGIQRPEKEKRLAGKAWTVFAASCIAVIALVLAFVFRGTYVGQNGAYPLAAFFLAIAFVFSMAAIFVVFAAIHLVGRNSHRNKN